MTTEINESNREHIIYHYINNILDGLGMEGMEDLLYHYMSNDISKLSNEELRDEILETHPELLE
jgi:hypothetical protein